MAGNLKEAQAEMAASLSNPLPSSGSTPRLPLKIILLLNGKHMGSNISPLCSLDWSVEGMGLVLNMTLNESVTIAPSTDPLLILTGDIWDYQASLPTYETPSSLRCTALSLSVGENLLTTLSAIHIINRNDASDRIYFLPYPP